MARPRPAAHGTYGHDVAHPGHEPVGDAHSGQYKYENPAFLGTDRGTGHHSAFAGRHGSAPSGFFRRTDPHGVLVARHLLHRRPSAPVWTPPSPRTEALAASRNREGAPEQAGGWAKSDSERDEAEARVSALLQKPLSADDAVQIALLNNDSLQASLFELEISEADPIQAGRLSNLGFSFAASPGMTKSKSSAALIYSLARLLAMPLMREMESRRFERTQREVTMADAQNRQRDRKAYYVAVSPRRNRALQPPGGRRC